MKLFSNAGFMQWRGAHFHAFNIDVTSCCFSDSSYVRCENYNDNKEKPWNYIIHPKYHKTQVHPLIFSNENILKLGLAMIMYLAENTRPELGSPGPTAQGCFRFTVGNK